MYKLECIALADMTSVPVPDETIVCLGNFDGVHVAHRALATQATALRQAYPNAATCALTFYEPSWLTLSKEPIPMLTTTEEKLEKFRDAGLSHVILCDFAEIKELSPAAFAAEILRARCHAVAAVCGYNYRFGKRGAGRAEELSSHLGAPVAICDEVMDGGIGISSTRIRALLSDGRPDEAARLLGAPYSFCAEVVHGKALGKKLGFPTLNQNFPAGKLIPRDGVYLTRCRVDGAEYYGISNVGVHPTVDHGAARNCETHLLDVEVDLYGKEVCTAFLSFLRPEQKFSDADALCRQIATDLAQARALIPKH